jgi:hypothetical protein
MLTIVLRLWRWFLRVLGLGAGGEFSKKRTEAYSLETFGDRASAREAAKRNGVAALVSTAGKQKWLLLMCPCGCGQEIALNLMATHSPRWQIRAGTSGAFSVHPSVDATSCGAHFWLTDGRVSWCE